MKLIITIDTEADNQWKHEENLTTNNINFCHPFQVLCEKYSINPTYLITSEIATDPNAIKFLRPLVEFGKAEVGAHLHPWTTPPFCDEPGLRFNDPIRAFPSELSYQLLSDKLELLTKQIEAAIGKRPTSFRAGRFGFNSDCAELLKQLGYLVDSSVTPFISWKNKKGFKGPGPDFSKSPVKPYWIMRNNEKQILEIPITILRTNGFLTKYPFLKFPYHIAYKLQSNRLFSLNLLTPQPIWMRPYPRTTAKHLIHVWQFATQKGFQNVVMMFHSSELMPGASPYRPNNESVNELLNIMEQIFLYVCNENSSSSTLTDAATRNFSQIKDVGYPI